MLDLMIFLPLKG